MEQAVTSYTVQILQPPWSLLRWILETTDHQGQESSGLGFGKAFALEHFAVLLFVVVVFKLVGNFPLDLICRHVRIDDDNVLQIPRPPLPRPSQTFQSHLGDADVRTLKKLCQTLSSRPS